MNKIYFCVAKEFERPFCRIWKQLICASIKEKKTHRKPEFNLKNLRYNKIMRKVTEVHYHKSIRIETKLKKCSKIHIFLNNKLTCDITF